ncbi:hypothetical protein RDWZM_006565 [Blomia tropicalis]|uniref:Uncharacterized protein n=1 Tax=Blomia tropicalis TaxID=40697 RepID=A0A9Q0M8Q6_BLOTA|nr:hypothetical protein RDWZM_006565 [Blomia tropicalis]
MPTEMINHERWWSSIRSSSSSSSSSSFIFFSTLSLSSPSPSTILLILFIYSLLPHAINARSVGGGRGIAVTAKGGKSRNLARPHDPTETNGSWSVMLVVIVPILEMFLFVGLAFFIRYCCYERIKKRNNDKKRRKRMQRIAKIAEEYHRQSESVWSTTPKTTAIKQHLENDNKNVDSSKSTKCNNERSNHINLYDKLTNESKVTQSNGPILSEPNNVHPKCPLHHHHNHHNHNSFRRQTDPCVAHYQIEQIPLDLNQIESNHQSSCDLTNIDNNNTTPKASMLSMMNIGYNRSHPNVYMFRDSKLPPCIIHNPPIHIPMNHLQWNRPF